MNVSGSLASGGLISRDTALSGYATSSDLNDLSTDVSTLNTTLSEYAKLTDVRNLTMTLINDRRSEYATSSDLDRLTDRLSEYATSSALSTYASLSANNTFTGDNTFTGNNIHSGTHTLNSGITVNKTTSNGSTYKYEVDDQGWTVEGPFRVKFGAQNLLKLIPRAHQQPTSSAQIGTNLIVTGNVSTTGTFTATPRTNLGGTGATQSYRNGVDPVLHVMHDSAWNVGRWVARATDGTWGWVAGNQSGVVTLPSDDRLKYNEVPVAGAIEYVKALQPRHYTKKKSLVDADEGGIEEYGFIAQDVESIEGLECLVVEDLDCRDPNLRVKHLNYNGVMTISMQALKELITRVEDLETRLAALESS